MRTPFPLKGENKSAPRAAARPNPGGVLLPQPLYRFTSNLYPIPHTVVRAHLP